MTFEMIFTGALKKTERNTRFLKFIIFVDLEREKTNGYLANYDS